MAVFDSCGCCSLRKGAVFVGVFQLLISLCLTCICVALVLIPDLEEFLENAWKKLYILNGPVIVVHENGSSTGIDPLNLTTSKLLLFGFSSLMCSVFFGATSLSNFLLVIGATKKMLAFILQWLVVQWISMLVTITVLGLVFWQLLVANSAGRYWWIIVFGSAIVILLLIALLFVLSLYQDFRDQEIPEIREDVELLNRQLWMPKYNKYYD